MDFTSAYLHAGGSSSSLSTPIFSPGSTFLAYLAGSPVTSVLVRTSTSLQAIRSWKLPSELSSVSWSPDGSRLLAVSTKDAVLFVLSLNPAAEDPEGITDDGDGWVARIDVGAEGISSAVWAPHSGSPAIVSFSQDELRVTIYDLVNGSATILDDPKKARLYANPKLPAFALLRRSKGKDGISVLQHGRDVGYRLGVDEQGWNATENFAIGTNDAADLAWSPEGLSMAICDSALEYKVQIYTALGAHRGTIMLDGPSHSAPAASLASSARGKGKARREDDGTTGVAGGGLGVRQMEWSPTSALLALGGYDEKVRIYEDTEWRELAVLDLAQRVYRLSAGVNPRFKAWQEPHGWFEESGGRGIVDFDEAALPLSPPAMRIDYTKPLPRCGISWMRWSPDGTLLAVRNDNLPSTLFIYTLPSGKSSTPSLVSALLFGTTVRHAAWRPALASGKEVGEGSTTSNKLAVVCEANALYMWEATAMDDARQGAEAVPVPIDDFKPSSLLWSPDGRKLLLADATRFCCAVEVD